MNGVTLRVAMRMGYHRDPSNFSGISPFQGEMRRRTWHVLNMMDTLISFTVGLPTSLRSLESDVRAPHNLYDHDISPDMAHVPKGRALSEITPATYTIAKSRVCRIFGEAAELSHRITPPKHSDIMALDRRLGESHDLIPEGMRVRPMEDCITDPPVLIMSRFNIELMYQKTRIVLHRSYLTAGQTDSRFALSRETCIDAAIMILNYQQVIVHACSPGGQLNKVWWYMSSLTTYDFLLAAMILCLELNHLQTQDPASAKIAELFDILHNTLDIWTNNPSRFKASARGAEMLRAMLQKASTGHEVSRATSESADGSQMHVIAPLTELTPPEEPEEAPPQIWGPWPQVDAASLDIPGIPSEIDWNLWDSTMQGQTNIIPQQNLAHNTGMDSWMGTNVPVVSNTDILHDFRDPLAMYNSSGYTLPAEEHNIWPLY